MNWSKDEWKIDLPQEKLNNINEMENHIDALETERKNLQFKVDAMQAVIDKLKYNEEVLKNEIIEHEKDEQTLRNDLVMKCESLEKLEPLVKGLEHQTKLLQTQLENAKEQKEKAINQCKIHENNVSVMHGSLEKVKAELKTKDLFLKEQQLNASEELEAAEKKLHKFQEDFQIQLVSRNKTLADQFQKSELALNGKVNELEIEKSINDSLKQQIQELEASIDELRKVKDLDSYNNPGIANSSWNLDVFKLRKKVNELENKNIELMRCLENNKRNVMSLTQTYEDKMSPMKNIQGSSLKLPSAFVSPSRCKSDPTLYSSPKDSESSCKRSLDGKSNIDNDSLDSHLCNINHYVVSRDSPVKMDDTKLCSNGACSRIISINGADNKREYNKYDRKLNAKNIKQAFLGNTANDESKVKSSSNNHNNNNNVIKNNSKSTSTEYLYSSKSSQDVAVATTQIKTCCQQTETNSIKTDDKLSQTQIQVKEKNTECNLAAKSSPNQMNVWEENCRNGKAIFEKLRKCLECINAIKISIPLQSENFVIPNFQKDFKEIINVEQLANMLEKSLEDVDKAVKLEKSKKTVFFPERNLPKKSLESGNEKCEFSSPGKVKELAAGWEKTGLIKSAVKELVRERQQTDLSEVNNGKQAQGSRANDFQHSVKCLLLWQQLCESRNNVTIYEKEIAGLKYQIKQLKVIEQSDIVVKESCKSPDCHESVNAGMSGKRIQPNCCAQNYMGNSSDVASTPIADKLKSLEVNIVDKNNKLENCLERIELRQMKLENIMDCMPPMVKTEVNDLSKNIKQFIGDEFGYLKTNEERNPSRNYSSPCDGEAKVIKIFKNVTVRSPNKQKRKASCSPHSHRSSSPGHDALQYFDELLAYSSTTRNSILTLYARVDELEAERKRLHDNHLNYSNKLSAKDNEIHELETKLAESNLKINENDSAYKSELESLKFEQLEIYKEFKDLCETLKCKEIEILNKNKMMKEIKTTMEQEKDKLANQQDEFEKTNKEITIQLDGYRNQLRRKNNEIDELITRLKLSEKSFLDLNTKLTTIDQIFIDCKRKSLY